MLRMAIKKLNIIPHSIAIASAVLLIWSTQANDPGLSASNMHTAQQAIHLQSLDEDQQSKDNKTATNVSIEKVVPANPWVVLRLF